MYICVPFELRVDELPEDCPETCNKVVCMREWCKNTCMYVCILLYLANWVYPLLFGWHPSLDHSLGLELSNKRPLLAGSAFPIARPTNAGATNSYNRNYNKLISCILIYIQ